MLYGPGQFGQVVFGGDVRAYLTVGDEVECAACTIGELLRVGPAEQVLPALSREGGMSSSQQPFQWRFTTSDLDDLLAGLDRRALDRQEESARLVA